MLRAFAQRGGNSLLRSRPTATNTNSRVFLIHRAQYSSSTRRPVARRVSSSTAQHGAKANSAKAEVAELRADIKELTYLLKQAITHGTETQALARKAEARASIIEHKLIDIQSHVVKISALESAANAARQYIHQYPAFTDVINRVGTGAFVNKYTAWALLASVILFWRYRVTMYQRTSEEVAEMASLTLQQDKLKNSIQKTLTTVANSPETLASLSILFQRLITEERTSQELVNLIVRALNSEGVRNSAIDLLEIAFLNPHLQERAGDFLKVAAHSTVLDESVQRATGVGLQGALRSAVLPGWLKKFEVPPGNSYVTEVASVQKEETHNKQQKTETPGSAKDEESELTQESEKSDDKNLLFPSDVIVSV